MIYNSKKKKQHNWTTKVVAVCGALLVVTVWLLSIVVPVYIIWHFIFKYW